MPPAGTLPEHFTEARIGGLLPGAESWLISQIITPYPHLILCANEQQKQQLAAELPFFTDLALYEFEDWETLPYDRFSPHQDIVSQRLKLLHELPHLKQGLILASIHSLMNPLCPPTFLEQQVLLLEAGQTLSLTEKREALVRAGYLAVEQVLAAGEFTVRGAILDIFPMGATQPFRVDLFGNQIDSIRLIDLETQRSGAPCERIELLPAHEFSLDTTSIQNFALAWQQHFPDNSAAQVLQQLKKGQAAPGLEYYLPLFYEGKIYSLFDYLPPSTRILRLPGLMESAQKNAKEISDRFNEKKWDLDYPPLPPQHLFLSPDLLFGQQKKWTRIDLLNAPLDKTSNTQINRKLIALPDISFKQQHSEPWKDLKNFVEAKHKKNCIIFCADSEGRAQVLSEHLNKLGWSYEKISTLPKAFLPQHLYLSANAQASGFQDEAQHLILITESELFPFRSQTKNKKRESKTSPGISLKDLSELNIDDLVVHLEHGIGRYKGLTTLNVTGSPQEFLSLDYAKGDRLYVPIHALHLISRYSQGKFAHALHSLGSDQWKKTREKAAKRITDLAAELLSLYAERQSKKGFACNSPNADYLSFVDAFAYEETDDQLRAINEVIKDMTAARPMDRLLCGDVGFGKTEVAMRAAFLAVQNGKQVALLVPTTLLAEQHYENFSSRFAPYGVLIKHFSRRTRSTEEAQILKELSEGRVDIIIGTHKLLNPKVKFKDLGLVIVDEEHRFGVKDKEKLKALKTEVDILSMTATPIPRTLNMSLSMLRDLSIIATPPAKRLPVKTFIKEYAPNLVKEAILREILRGGQVYYLYNYVAGIEQKCEALQQLLPDLKIIAAHGQMQSRVLEKIMADFYHNRIHVLVCTSIIETGIDVPNANTLIVERADEFGLAQLHQLRGRVGRSHHQAYAYLLSPPKNALSRDAQKRLEAISQNTALGAGFSLATHDLEIRGAGDILGDEQSGQMTEIGVGLYLELLDRAVHLHKQGQSLSADLLLTSRDSDVELNISRMFPDDYIPDIHQRLKLYQRLSLLENEAQLIDFKIELIDRFGPLPESAHHLLISQELKIKAKALGITKIELHQKGGKIEFATNIHFDPLKLIQLVQSRPHELQLRGEKLLLLKMTLLKATDRINTIHSLMETLS